MEVGSRPGQTCRFMIGFSIAARVARSVREWGTRFRGADARTRRHLPFAFRRKSVYGAADGGPEAASDRMPAMSANTFLVPKELLEPVVAWFRPRRVILFGSVARGDAAADSDIDLLVILDDDAPREKLTLKAGFEARRSYRRAADVIPCRESDYAERASIVGTLAYEVAKDGILVYQRSGR